MIFCAGYPPLQGNKHVSCISYLNSVRTCPPSSSSGNPDGLSRTVVGASIHGRLYELSGAGSKNRRDGIVRSSPLFRFFRFAICFRFFPLGCFAVLALGTPSFFCVDVHVMDIHFSIILEVTPGFWPLL